MIWRAVPMALLIAASPALAFDTNRLGQGGSITLDEKMSLIDKSPKLKREIDEALAKINKKPEDIICAGSRFPREWRYLGGERVAPYTCDIGDKTLSIEADVRVSGRAGQVFERNTPQAMKNARRVSETNPTWKWGPALSPDRNQR